ncbi:hypothetical protein PILCRDRAFT_293509 [Piloderma croceum F 1598]|uniref:Uncharacterized protein n=1 Tax=Piloderma croceum (strain F 1598) TaxID=765440 RepID=A0A0C3G565_PILCF|nr:hypothetical protein PILCRDRAFT_293509 [Piloderma croceum F 1598]
MPWRSNQRAETKYNIGTHCTITFSPCPASLRLSTPFYSSPAPIPPLSSRKREHSPHQIHLSRTANIPIPFSLGCWSSIPRR